MDRCMQLCSSRGRVSEPTILYIATEKEDQRAHIWEHCNQTAEPLCELNYFQAYYSNIGA